MNSLITGASGFVGQNLLKYFYENKIDTFYLTRDALQGDEISISDHIDSIIHLAGKAHDLKSSSSQNEYYEVNFGLTKKLFDAFLVSPAKIFIFVSSVKAVADTVEGVLTEEAVPEPKTDYGKSKLMAEKYIQSVELPSDKRVYILRPCMIHGPGNKGNLNLLYQFVKSGIPYPLAAFDNKRSFLSIDNLCFVMKEIISRSNFSAGVYNVCDDEALSTNEVVGILASSLRRRKKLWRIPEKLVRSMAKLGDYLRLPINTDRLHKLTGNYVVSNTKLKQELRIALPTQASAGLMNTARSFDI
ncbi:MAG: NAD-dependent epimerase/dehydratase family protein [Bacteroidota bacterium]